MTMQQNTTDCAIGSHQCQIWGGKMMKVLGAAVLLALAMVMPASAQSVPVYGVTTCGTPPTTIANGKPAYLTVLAGSGALCFTGTFTPGGTQNVNLTQYNSIAVPANGLPTQLVGTAAIATGQASITNSVASFVNARPGVVGTGRKSVCVTNITGTGPVYIGPSGITTSTGTYIPGVAGASICLDTQAAIYGIVPSVNQTVSFVETY